MRTKQPKNMAVAARDVRLAMTSVHTGINAVASTTGILMAMADNADGTETLSSIRSDECYQLVGALSKAYGELADFLAKAFDQ